MTEEQQEKQQKTAGKRRRTLKFALRIVAGCVSLVLLAVLVMQAALWSGVFWLQSASGQQWMARTLAQVSENSGVRISVDGINGPNLRGFGVAHLRLSDAEGDFLTAQDVKLSLDVSHLLSRALSLSLTAAEIDLLRLPLIRGDAGQAAQDITLPDLYFSSIRLSSLDIEKLVIAPAVAGSAIETGVTGDAGVKLDGQGLTVNFLLALSQEKVPLMPRKIEGKARIVLPEGKITVSDFTASGPQYELTAKGKYGIRGDALETHTTLKTAAMPQLGGGSLDLAADVTGTVAVPLVSAKGVLSLPETVAPGLDDIAFELSTDKTLAGHALAKTKWRDLPAKLAADYSFTDGVLTLDDIKGDAPDIAVKGGVKLDTATKIATGKIAARFDLARYRELAGHDIDGNGSADITLSSQDGHQAADIDMKLTSARYEGYGAAGVTAHAEYKDFSAVWPDRAQATLKDAKLDGIGLPRLSAIITPAQDGQFRLEADGQALFPQTLGFKGTAVLGGDTPETAYARDIAFNLAPRKGSIRVTGVASLEKIDIELQPKNVPLDALPVAVPAVVASVEATGKVKISGTPAAPRIESSLDFSPVALRKDVPALVTHADATLADGKLDVNATGKGKGVRKLRAHINMPLSLSLYPFSISDIGNAPLSATIDADMELKPLTAALLPADMVLNGNATVTAEAHGTVASPQLSGDAVLTQGYFRDETAGFALKAVELHASVANDTLRLTSFSARDEKNGTITATGTVGYASPSLPVDLSIKAQDIGHFVNQDAFNGDFSGDLTLKGDRDGYKMGGTVKAGEVNITIPDRFDSDIPRLNVVREKTQGKRAPDFMQAVALHVDFSAPNRVFVRGWGLDAEFGGAVAITGTLKEPLFDGTLESRRGRYEEFGRVFTFDHAALRFQGTVPPSPYLDIQAVTKVDDITAQVNLTGSVKEPAIALSAVPAMPQDEVLSHILFGKDMSKISPFQAVQLASSLRRLTGKGGNGFEPLGAIRKATGLENLQVETDENGGTTVGAGKYITDKVYLEAEKGSGEKSGAAALKIDITPHLKAESKIGQDNKSGGSLNWEWDY